MTSSGIRARERTKTAFGRAYALRARSRVRQRLFRVTLMAQPRHVSRVVTFQRRLRNGQWAKVKRVQLRALNLSARFSARLPRGVNRVRIAVPQTPGYLGATSAHVRVVR